MNCRLLSLALLLSSLGAQGLKITHMEGTYDLDGDGLQEFASVELGSSSNKKLSVIRYYELDEDNYQQMRWELEAPDGLLGNFVDAELGDLDGDGIPELITVSNLAEPNWKPLLALEYHRHQGLLAQHQQNYQASHRALQVPSAFADNYPHLIHNIG
jgi:hypothetical protein